MEKYNYFESVYECIEDYLVTDGHINEAVAECGNDVNELHSYLEDELFCNDSVTGNASGSFTFSRWKAEENICHNLDLVEEAYNEFGYEFKDIPFDNPEAIDVSIRCYLLSQCLYKFLEDYSQQNFS